jgi:hypothetical protein
VIVLAGAGLVAGAAAAATWAIARAGGRLTRRPARGAPHTVWRDIYPNPPGRIGTPCRCVIGRDHWQDAA